MKNYLLIYLLFLSLFCRAQNQNSIWCFGDSSGINFGIPTTPFPFISSVNGRGSCTSISNGAGVLAFYSNTRTGLSGNTARVWDKNHQLMLNGDSIVGESWYNELTIVPFPEDSNKYYLFSIGITGSSQYGFYYSVIDLQQNGGLGKVMQKNILLLNDEMADCLTAVKHGNGRDWWVIVKPGTPPVTFLNRFFIYLITPLGISSPIIQDLNNAVDGDFQRLTSSSDASKLMQIISVGFMCEYDFDRCTGLISNPNVIFTGQTSNYTRIFWEGAYSPNDSLFYVTTTWYSFPNDTSRLLQYNLFAPDIPASCDTLFSTEHPVQLEGVRLAPDSKVYVSSFYDCQCLPNSFPYPDSVRNIYNENLSVINNPNSDGISCNFQPYSFYLGGKRTYFGLPNNPNYGLGPLVGSPCDTITSNLNEQALVPSNLYLYYNSQWEKLFVNAKNIRGYNCMLQIVDLSGKKVYSSATKIQPPYFTQDIDLSTISNGMYIINLLTEKERLTGKFVKE